MRSVAAVLLAACLACAGTAQAGERAGLGLSIEDFELFNGEGGNESWRLQAVFGNVRRDGDDVDLEKPDLRYDLGGPGAHDYLLVKAGKGRIGDGQNVVELWDDVVVTHGSDTVVTEFVRYDFRTRVMFFPHGATLTCKEGRMAANELEWDLNSDTLSARRGVTTVVLPRPGGMEGR